MGMAGSVAARSPLGLVNDTLGASGLTKVRWSGLGYRPLEVSMDR